MAGFAGQIWQQGSSGEGICLASAWSDGRSCSRSGECGMLCARPLLLSPAASQPTCIPVPHVACLSSQSHNSHPPNHLFPPPFPPCYGRLPSWPWGARSCCRGLPRMGSPWCLPTSCASAWGLTTGGQVPLVGGLRVHSRYYGRFEEARNVCLRVQCVCPARLLAHLPPCTNTPCRPAWRCCAVVSHQHTLPTRLVLLDCFFRRRVIDGATAAGIATGPLTCLYLPACANFGPPLCCCQSALSLLAGSLTGPRQQALPATGSSMWRTQGSCCCTCASRTAVAAHALAS